MTQELRKLAEAATQGIWNHIQRGISRWHGERIEVDLDPLCDFSRIQNGCVHPYKNAYENAAFVAAANPAAILALLDRVEKAEKDAARLDWLDSQGYAYGFQDMHEGNRWTIDGPFANLRIAIDESMEASK